MIEKFIKQYESYLQEIDEKCAAVYENLPNLPCFPKCTDRAACCKQIFPLTFLEAYYLSIGFKKLGRAVRRELEKSAQKSRKQLVENFSASGLKPIYANTDYDTHNAAQQSITKFLHDQKIPCPFLSDELCKVYPFRNFGCRLHGLAYDYDTNEILGCYRHKEIFPHTNDFATHAIKHNLLNKEKIRLDGETITTLTNNNLYRQIRYLTHPFMPILKDFETFDWNGFFTEKISPQEIIPETYTLIFD